MWYVYIYSVIKVFKEGKEEGCGGEGGWRFNEILYRDPEDESS